MTAAFARCALTINLGVRGYAYLDVPAHAYVVTPQAAIIGRLFDRARNSRQVGCGHALTQAR